MIIIGAKGFAKELLTVLHDQLEEKEIVFFDDVSKDIGNKLYNRFPILKTWEEARRHVALDNRFMLGIGQPNVRRLMTERFSEMGGILTSVISPKATISSFGVEIGVGCCIMSGTCITSDITIGKAVLVNLNCTIGHDSFIGDFAELSPGVHVSGHCRIGACATIGTGAVLLPGCVIGERSVIGAGAVVKGVVEDDSLAVGIPAKVIRKLNAE